MRSWVLGSGSQGNAVLLEADDGYVLVDAGFAVRELTVRLRAIGITPGSVEAVILTHEHADHARSAAAGARSFGWRVYASPLTIACTAELRGTGATAVIPGERIALSTMDFSTVSVPHDAAQPVAVIATSRRTGVRTGVAYDLGTSTTALRRALADLDVLIVEANHDPGMLRAGPYPPSVAHRIAGPRGHLSNTAAAELASAVAHQGLAHVVLAHLSLNCNEPALAVRAVAAALRGGVRGAIPVSVSSQNVIAGPFGPRSRCRGPEPVQLSLGLA